MFRDTVVVAGLAVAGVVAMLVWSGGEAPAGVEPPEQSEVPSGFTLPPDATLPADLAPATGGQDEAGVVAQDALIAALPVPTGGTEMTPAGAGVRTWTLASPDWETVRDGHLGVLREQGFVVASTGPFVEGATVGERYTLTDPSGTVSLQLAVATFDGQTVIQVTR